MEHLCPDFWRPALQFLFPGNWYALLCCRLSFIGDRPYFYVRRYKSKKPQKKIAQSASDYALVLVHAQPPRCSLSGALTFSLGVLRSVVKGMVLGPAIIRQTGE
jgi:hypothetical protein